MREGFDPCCTARRRTIPTLIGGVKTEIPVYSHRATVARWVGALLLCLALSAYWSCGGGGEGEGSGSPKFLYVNNDRSPSNVISAFKVNADGSLTPIAGAPYATGGNGFEPFRDVGSIRALARTLYAT